MGGTEENLWPLSVSGEDEGSKWEELKKTSDHCQSLEKRAANGRNWRKRVTTISLFQIGRPVYPYGFAVIPTDSDHKFRCYAGSKITVTVWFFLSHILSWSKTTGTGSKLSKGQNQVMTGNYFPWNTDYACLLLKLCFCRHLWSELWKDE